MKCNEILSKWCKNKHGASKIIDMLETYQSLLQALGPVAKGWSGGKFSPFPIEHSLRVSPWAGRLGLRGLVRLAQVATTLTFRPTQASVKWVHNGPTLEPSRTFSYNTDKLQNFSGIQNLLSFI
jgi:hypothetical protein